MPNLLRPTCYLAAGTVANSAAVLTFQTLRTGVVVPSVVFFVTLAGCIVAAELIMRRCRFVAAAAARDGLRKHPVERIIPHTVTAPELQDAIVAVLAAYPAGLRLSAASARLAAWWEWPGGNPPAWDDLLAAARKLLASGRVVFYESETGDPVLRRNVPSPAPPDYFAGLLPPPFRFSYQNHEDKIAKRIVLPIRVYYGTSHHHAEPQWLLHALCLDRRQERTFAFSRMTEPE